MTHVMAASMPFIYGTKVPIRLAQDKFPRVDPMNTHSSPAGPSHDLFSKTVRLLCRYNTAILLLPKAIVLHQRQSPYGPRTQGDASPTTAGPQRLEDIRSVASIVN